MKKRILCLALAMLTVLTCLAPFTTADAAAMSSSQAIIDKMKAREGFRSTPYWDVSHYSIGYGTTCPDNMVDYYKKNPMTEAQAEAEFRKYLTKYETAVNNFATKHGLTLQQHQFDALVSFTYNCGSGWMSSTSGYFNTAVRSGDVGAELLYGMALYSTAGGEYILIGRRLWEANVYLNGDYGEGAKGSYPDNYRWVFLDGNGGTVRYKICAFDTNHKASLPVAFKYIPTGKDANGNTFVYSFAGWYDTAGNLVTELNSSLSRGDYLYARWKDPDGKFREDETFPSQTFPVQATIVNVDESANVRKGPGTSYGKNGTVAKDQRVTVYEEVKGEYVSSYGTNLWCRIGNEKWVLKKFVEYDKAQQTPTTGPTGPEGTSITSLKLIKGPDQTEYLQGTFSPNWEGSVMLATYANGYTEGVTATRSMCSGFDGTKLGQQTITATYEGKKVTFKVSVFAGTLQSIAVTTLPTKQIYGLNTSLDVSGGRLTLYYENNAKLYTDLKANMVSGFNSSKLGTQTLTVTYGGKTTTFDILVTKALPGDFNKNNVVTDADAVYLLMHTFFPEEYPIAQNGDFNGDKAVTDADAVYLLMHTFFPDDYPIK